jgi:hypothetical protein
MTNSTPGTMADDLERLLAGDRRPHHLLDVFSISYLPDIHAYRLAFPPQPLLFSATPSIGIDAGHKGTVAEDGGLAVAPPPAIDSARDPGACIRRNTSINIETICSQFVRYRIIAGSRGCRKQLPRNLSKEQ